MQGDKKKIVTRDFRAKTLNKILKERGNCTSALFASPAGNSRRTNARWLPRILPRSWFTYNGALLLPRSPARRVDDDDLRDNAFFSVSNLRGRLSLPPGNSYNDFATLNIDRRRVNTRDNFFFFSRTNLRALAFIWTRGAAVTHTHPHARGQFYADFNKCLSFRRYTFFFHEIYLTPRLLAPSSRNTERWFTTVACAYATCSPPKFFPSFIV